MICARGELRKPVSHALGYFRSLAVRVLRLVCVLPLALRVRLLASSVEPAHDPGRI